MSVELHLGAITKRKFRLEMRTPSGDWIPLWVKSGHIDGPLGDAEVVAGAFRAADLEVELTFGAAKKPGSPRDRVEISEFIQKYTFGQ